jgi:hypothetical protein
MRRENVSFRKHREERGIPGSSDVLVLVALEVGIQRSVRKMESKGLQKGRVCQITNSPKTEKKKMKPTFCELTHSVFWVLVEYIFKVVT